MADTAAFRAAVLEDVARFTAAMPKFELHAHINGSIPLAVLQQFAAADVVAETEAESQNGGAAGNHNKLTSKSAAQCVADDVSVFMTPLGPEATPSDRMAHCFKVFDVVYKLVRTRERLVAATRAVVRSFADEGCAYLELRTTP